MSFSKSKVAIHFHQVNNADTHCSFLLFCEHFCKLANWLRRSIIFQEYFRLLGINALFQVSPFIFLSISWLCMSFFLYFIRKFTISTKNYSFFLEGYIGKDPFFLCEKSFILKPSSRDNFIYNKLTLFFSSNRFCSFNSGYFFCCCF